MENPEFIRYISDLTGRSDWRDDGAACILDTAMSDGSVISVSTFQDGNYVWIGLVCHTSSADSISRIVTSYHSKLSTGSKDVSTLVSDVKTITRIKPMSRLEAVADTLDSLGNHFDYNASSDDVLKDPAMFTDMPVDSLPSYLANMLARIAIGG